MVLLKLENQSDREMKSIQNSTRLIVRRNSIFYHSAVNYCMYGGIQMHHTQDLDS